GAIAAAVEIEAHREHAGARRGLGEMAERTLRADRLVAERRHDHEPDRARHHRAMQPAKATAEEPALRVRHEGDDGGAGPRRRARARRPRPAGRSDTPTTDRGSPRTAPPPRPRSRRARAPRSRARRGRPMYRAGTA